jgi:uncharacterized membrane protein
VDIPSKRGSGGDDWRMKLTKIIKISAVFIVMSVFACMLTLYRMRIIEGTNYIFLIWNLFLAWIPFVFSCILALCDRIKNFPLKFCMMAIIGLLWLIFYPNAPYILTDYAHFSWVGFFKGQAADFDFKPWYDFVLFSAYIITGFILGMASLRINQGIIRKHSNGIVSGIFVVIVQFLSSIAIYWGRFMRMNSWDAWRNPLLLVEGLKFNEDSWIFVLILTVFLSLVYFAFNIWCLDDNADDDRLLRLNNKRNQDL